MVNIKSLWIYPVKSLRGFTVDSAILSSQGLEYDRHWMVINENNQFITQRKFSEMILIHTHIEDGQLILSKPNEPSLGTYNIPTTQQSKAEKLTATVWGDTCQVYDEGKAVSDWLTQAIGSKKALRLVRMAEDKRIQSKPELTLPEFSHVETDTLFADAAPFLTANPQSLDLVNQQMLAAGHTSITMEHFRPNIVLDGLAAFAEHQIQTLNHQDYQLRHCYPCQRCVIPTIDVNTGLRHSQQQPFSLIAEINSMPNKTKAPAFGENAILIKGHGQTIRVGDNLTTEYSINNE